MSAVAVIDSLEFARAEQQLSGNLQVRGFTRLEDVLFDLQGSVDYDVRGKRDERNRPQLELRITGGLHLQCQRCLGLLDYEVDVANRLLIVQRGAQSGDDMDDPEAPDTIEASADLEIAGLIEDEVLLSLPLSPRHAEGVCVSRFPSTRPAGDVPKAFAQLAALRQPRNTR